MGGWYKKALSAITVAIMSALLATVPAAAADPATPTSFTLLSVRAFHNLYETGDVLYTFEYDIYYASSQPVPPATSIFLFRLMDPTGATLLGTASPYPYNNSGYDMGVGAFYFDADSAPTWESAVIVRMDGNPQYWSSPPTFTHPLLLSEYCQFDDQDANRTQLGNWILDVSVDIEVNWGIKLTTEGAAGTVLTTTGETYFKGTIAGVKEMAPQIFNITIEEPDVTDPPPISTSLIYQWEHQWDGTWVADALGALGGIFGGISYKQAMAVIVFALTAVGAGIAQIKWGTTDPAFIGGMVLFAFASVAGLVDWQVIAAGSFLSILYIVYLIFWNK